MNTVATYTTSPIGDVNNIDKNTWKKSIEPDVKKKIVKVVQDNFRKQAAFIEWTDNHIFHYVSRALLQFWDESSSQDEFFRKIAVFSDVQQTPPPPLGSIQRYPMYMASVVASRPRTNVISYDSSFQPSGYWEKVRDMVHLRPCISPQLTILERQCRELEALNELPICGDMLNQTRAKFQANIALGSYLIRVHREMAMSDEQIQAVCPPSERDYHALLAVEKMLLKTQGH
jgi:hypothetical protein